MTPTKAIETLDVLVDQVDELRHVIEIESNGITQQWLALKQQGANREDMAAELLTRLRPHLDALHTLAELSSQSITDFMKNPFVDQ
jgi:hypothetical protein